ncbi:hypothetical protein JQS30_05290 [Natronoglycomyces albus]|uniref:Tail specific protease domain-containing protein n=1 Tax=Natronoglycomyces albus TaxID=2811108 RepID=A0A895XSU9_9ACTN|nr:hypothetical protein JQS30_05290 [Natronoglycomyces albus]
MVIDIRFNEGGHAAAAMIDLLRRHPLAYRAQRWGTALPYPAMAGTPKLALLCNEYTGSEGEVLARLFSIHRLGSVVGRQTLGGAIGIRPRSALVDTTIATQPEYPFVFPHGHDGLENHGHAPDVVADNTPNDHRRGFDRQLAQALMLLGSPHILDPPSHSAHRQIPRSAIDHH